MLLECYHQVGKNVSPRYSTRYVGRPFIADALFDPSSVTCYKTAFCASLRLVLRVWYWQVFG
jgi:hypothetical protein